MEDVIVNIYGQTHDKGELVDSSMDYVMDHDQMGSEDVPGVKGPVPFLGVNGSELGDVVNNMIQAMGRSTGKLVENEDARTIVSPRSRKDNLDIFFPNYFETNNGTCKFRKVKLLMEPKGKVINKKI